jgi:hypothetical protein
VAEIQRIPQVIVHAVASGSSLDGTAPNGVDSGESLYRGRYRTWTVCTHGGLIALPVAFGGGWGVQRVMWDCGGIGSLTVTVVDEAGFEYDVDTVAADSGTWAPSEGVLPILPGWALKLVGANPLSADGRVAVYVGRGWGQDLFDSAPILGSEQYPPARQP